MRTVLDLDDGALARASALLGTATPSETVNRALRLVAEAHSFGAVDAHFEELLDLVGERLAETDVRAAAWR